MILSSKIVDYLFIPLDSILEIRDLSCYQVNVHESALEGIKGRLIERYMCASTSEFLRAPRKERTIVVTSERSESSSLY